jgi:hypothetical protein
MRELRRLLGHAKIRALISNLNINGAKPVECAIAAVVCVAPSLATRFLAPSSNAPVTFGRTFANQVGAPSVRKIGSASAGPAPK